MEKSEMSEQEQAATDLSEVDETVIEESAPSEETQEENNEFEQTPLEGKPTQTTGFQKRINKVTADKYREKQRADALQAELEKVRQEAATVQPVDKAPKLEDFDYDEDAFLDAKVQHQVSKATAKIAADNDARAAAIRRDQAAATFAEKVAKSGIEDYSETIQNLVEAVPLPAKLVDAIQIDEKGPELAYYLGKHLDVADRLANTDPLAAALELGKISAGLSNKRTKQTTKAPDPVKPAGSGGVSTKSQDKMTMEEIYNS